MRRVKMNDAELRAAVESMHRIAVETEERIAALADSALAAIVQPEGRFAAAAALRDIIRLSETAVSDATSIADDADALWFPSEDARRADMAIWPHEKRDRQ